MNFEVILTYVGLILLTSIILLLPGILLVFFTRRVELWLTPINTAASRFLVTTFGKRFMDAYARIYFWTPSRPFSLAGARFLGIIFLLEGIGAFVFVTYAFLKALKVL